MKLFIDTANLNEIEEASKWGFIKGVTTNPSLIAKEGLTQKDVITRIAKLIDGPISAEVTANDAEGMIKQGQELHAICPKNIVIKLPMTLEGLKACQFLTSKGIRTNVTLCFSVNQALLAFESNASFVSPFLGRLDDNGWDSNELVKEIMAVKKNYGYKSEVIMASIRSEQHVKLCALEGADIATVPYKVLVKLIQHPLTDSGLNQFALDAKKTADLKK
ncbi:MAG: fructose-6-phosphate aldolase [Bacilli bacterium]|jgi:transaldolase